MDQRDSHCPYSLSSEITAKPTVLGFVLMCNFFCVTWVLPPTYFFTDSVSCFGITTGCYVQQRGKKTLLSLTLICYCHLVGMAKIVRGSTFIVRPWNTATWRFGWLTVLALPFYSISKTQTYVQLFDSLRRSLNSFVWAFIIHQIQLPSGIWWVASFPRYIIRAIFHTLGCIALCWLGK